MSENPMKKQALLIGINEYECLTGLKYARQDAEAVADSLKQNYCFSDNEVMLLTDNRPGLFKPTDKYFIRGHLEKLADQDLDLFIFGFWGHGLIRNGKRYLCPLNVQKIYAEHQGFPFDELQELLANIHAKNTCLILDCCQTVHDRSVDEEESLTASDQTSMENAARDIGLKRKEQIPGFKSNVAILNSCKEGQSAYEWDARQHGLFTAFLLDAMKNRFSSVLQIASYISGNIEQEAMKLGKEQTPFYRSEGDIQLPVAPIPQSPESVHSPKPENPVPPVQNALSQPIPHKNLTPTSRSSFIWDGTKITSFSGYETEVVIPEGTTEIGYNAFMNCRSLKSVVIPQSVTKIGTGAFDGCSSLTSVVIPEGVTEIGILAFMKCISLKSVAIPKSVTKIENGAFEGCSSLTSVVIPEGVTEIEYSAFSDCSSLTSVVIPEGVTKIEFNAFSYCSSLTSVVIPEGVTEIGDRAFCRCISLTSVVIPKSVTKIGNSVFADCSALKEWIISSEHPYFKSDGVALLTKDGKKLVVCLASTKEYQIPEGVTKIGDYAFEGCSSLTSVVIPESVTEIGKCAFRNCSSLTSVVIPEDVTEIGEGAFEECSSLTSVSIPEGVTEIESGAFYACRSLTSVVIPAGVTKIGNIAFANCSSLTSVVIPKSVTIIGYKAFSGCPVPWFSRAWWHKD